MILRVDLINIEHFENFNSQNYLRNDFRFNSVI